MSQPYPLGDDREDGRDDTVPVPPGIENICPTLVFVTEERGILRESRFINTITWLMIVVTGVFTIALIFWSDQITSRQWLYLFTFPGGVNTWIGLFGGSTLAMAVGLIARWHRVTAVGNAVLALASALVAIAYAIAPLVGEGNAVTFGWYSWLMALIPSMLGSVIYWRPIQWF